VNDLNLECYRLLFYLQSFLNYRSYHYHFQVERSESCNNSSVLVIESQQLMEGADVIAELSTSVKNYFMEKTLSVLIIYLSHR
jgi:hypothetical protein